jgi:hypothetical protein
VADDVPDVARDLYQLPPAGFVAARDALAKQLRADGDREAATAVKSLRRPSVAAGFLNALAHDHPDELAALMDLGDELRQAQDARVRGEEGDVSGLSKDRREAIGGLTARSGAQGGAHESTVAATLEAASADADLAAQVQSGTLSDVPTPGGGFGFGFGFELSADDEGDEPAPLRPKAKAAKATKKAKAGAVAPKEDDGPSRADELAAKRRVKAVADAEAAESEASSLQADAEDAAAEVDHLRAELSAAEARSTDAAKAARRATTAAATARKKAERLASP